VSIRRNVLQLALLVYRVCHTRLTLSQITPLMICSDTVKSKLIRQWNLAVDLSTVTFTWAGCSLFTLGAGDTETRSLLLGWNLEIRIM